MQRLLDADYTELRQNHLFDLGYLCSVPAPQVDALRFWDFIQLVVDIQAHHKAIEERDKALGTLANV